MNTGTPLQFCPASMEKLKARYAEAMKYLTSVSAVLNHQMARPGQQRKHVFDGNNGLRIIASRDMWQNLEVIHFSCSIGSGALYNMDRSNGFEAAKAKFLEDCKAMIVELSGINPDTMILHFSDNQIPHFFVELHNLN